MKKIKDAFPDLNRELKFIPLGKEKPQYLNSIEIENFNNKRIKMSITKKINKDIILYNKPASRLNNPKPIPVFQTKIKLM